MRQAKRAPHDNLWSLVDTHFLYFVAGWFHSCIYFQFHFHLKSNYFHLFTFSLSLHHAPVWPLFCVLVPHDRRQRLEWAASTQQKKLPMLILTLVWIELPDRIWPLLMQWITVLRDETMHLFDPRSEDDDGGLCGLKYLCAICVRLHNHHLHHISMLLLLLLCLVQQLRARHEMRFAVVGCDWRVNECPSLSGCCCCLFGVYEPPPSTGSAAINVDDGKLCFEFDSNGDKRSSEAEVKLPYNIIKRFLSSFFSIDLTP